MWFAQILWVSLLVHLHLADFPHNFSLLDLLCRLPFLFWSPMEKPFSEALSSAFGSSLVVSCHVMSCHIHLSLHLHACDYHCCLFANGPTFYASDSRLSWGLAYPCLQWMDWMILFSYVSVISNMSNIKLTFFPASSFLFSSAIVTYSQATSVLGGGSQGFNVENQRIVDPFWWMSEFCLVLGRSNRVKFFSAWAPPWESTPLMLTRWNHC